MLTIKVTSDLDVFNNRVVRMEIKSPFDTNKNMLLRSMGFTWDKYTKSHTKLVTNKLEAKQLIKHLSKSSKDYCLEYIRIVKRKRSASLNKMISSVKTNKTKSDLKFF